MTSEFSTWVCEKIKKLFIIFLTQAEKSQGLFSSNPPTMNFNI